MARARDPKGAPSWPNHTPLGEGALPMPWADPDTLSVLCQFWRPPYPGARGPRSTRRSPSTGAYGISFTDNPKIWAYAWVVVHGGIEQLELFYSFMVWSWTYKLLIRMGPIIKLVENFELAPTAAGDECWHDMDVKCTKYLSTRRKRIKLFKSGIKCNTN